jgi:hypothetical protein
MADNADMNELIRRGRTLPLYRSRREPEPEPESPKPEPVDLGAGPRPVPSPADPHAAFNAWLRGQARKSRLEGQDVIAPTSAIRRKP